MKIIKEDVTNTHFTKVACHLCGEEYLVPNQYAPFINAENPFECANCRAELRRRGRR